MAQGASLGTLISDPTDVADPRLIREGAIDTPLRIPTIPIARGVF